MPDSEGTKPMQQGQQLAISAVLKKKKFLLLVFRDFSFQGSHGAFEIRYVHHLHTHTHTHTRTRTHTRAHTRAHTQTHKHSHSQ